MPEGAVLRRRCDALVPWSGSRVAGALGVAGLATTLVVQPGRAFDETELRLPSEVPGGRRFHRWGRSTAGGIQASSKRERS